MSSDYKPRFDPSEGIVTVPTVREFVQSLLDAGYFDSATACLVTVSSDTKLGIEYCGRPWECFALAAHAFARLGDRS